MKSILVCLGTAVSLSGCAYFEFKEMEQSMARIEESRVQTMAPEFQAEYRIEPVKSVKAGFSKALSKERSEFTYLILARNATEVVDEYDRFLAKYGFSQTDLNRNPVRRSYRAKSVRAKIALQAPDQITLDYHRGHGLKQKPEDLSEVTILFEFEGEHP